MELTNPKPTYHKDPYNWKIYYVSTHMIIETATYASTHKQAYMYSQRASTELPRLHAIQIRAYVHVYEYDTRSVCCAARIAVPVAMLLCWSLRYNQRPHIAIGIDNTAVHRRRSSTTERTHPHRHASTHTRPWSLSNASHVAGISIIHNSIIANIATLLFATARDTSML